MRWNAAIMALLLALACAGCGSDAPSGPPTPGPRKLVACNETAAPFYEAAPQLKDLQAHCANWLLKRNGTRDVEIQVLILGDQVDAPLARRDVVVYHAGGPGVSAIRQMLGNPPQLDYSRFAVLAWDGFTSRDLAGTCGQATTKFLTERTEGDFVDLAPQVTSECAGGWDSPLELGAWAAAEELEDVRSSLGIEQLSLFTISFGTSIAEAYLVMHPEAVRLAVLDAPIGLEVPWADRVRLTSDASATLANLLAEACTTAACSAITSGAQAGHAFDALRAAVLEGRPFVGSGDVNLSPTMFDQAAEVAVRSKQTWPAWSTAIDQALGGDGSALWRIGFQSIDGMDWADFYWSMCATIDRPSDARDYRGMATPLSFARTSLFAPCAGFPRGVARPARSGGKPPVLVVASAHDPLAPASLLAFSPRLSSFGAACVTHVDGHTSLGSGDQAISDLIFDFLKTGDTQAAAARCSALPNG